MPVVEKRYAEALLATAKDPKEADCFGNALHELCVSFQNDAETYDFFIAPNVSAGIKKEAVKKIFPQENLKFIVNFVSLLIDKSRMDLLSDIDSEYQLLKDERQNKLEIKLSSAMPLEESQIEVIVDKYKKQYGASSAYVVQIINPTLLGGILIQIGDIRIDDTQLGRLNALKRSINDVNTV